MYWSGNYIGTKDLTSLLKEDNVKLTDVLEADNVLQECKAENQLLTKYLSRPEILSELITLITEEPPKDVELMSQYRHASLACEVLTSFPSIKQLIVQNVHLLHQLCDFLNQEPPLNPLLASYFSKTVEVLLEKDPSRNGYEYRIACLQVLDVFCNRADFLPNLLRHMSTSAIADVFKYFIRLEDYFCKNVMQWFEENKLMDSLIQIVCGTYAVEVHTITLPPPPPPPPQPEGEGAGEGDNAPPEATEPCDIEEQNRKARLKARMSAAAADNAEALLRELLLTGCMKDPYDNWSSAGLWLRGMARGGVGRALREWFSREPRARPPAALVLAALAQDCRSNGYEAAGGGSTGGTDNVTRADVELAIAPHLPLIHQELMRAPPPAGWERGEETARRVGATRVALCSVLAELAHSAVPEVPAAMLALGTPALLLRLFVEHPDNNFLHAAVAVFVCRALSAPEPHCTRYAEHLLVECDLLTMLMDAFEENENRKQTGVPRAGYMGHVVVLLGALAARLQSALGELLPARAAARWAALRPRLEPELLLHRTPLGGVYPTDNMYEEPAEMEPETVYDNIDYDKDAFKMDIDRDIPWSSRPDDAEFDNVLAEVPPELLEETSPWENSGSDCDIANEDWAQFNEVFADRISGDPFGNANEQSPHQSPHQSDQGFINKVFDNTGFTNRLFDAGSEEFGNFGSDTVTKIEGVDTNVEGIDAKFEKIDANKMVIESDLDFSEQLSPHWSYDSNIINNNGEGAITSLAKIIENLSIEQAAPSSVGSTSDANISTNTVQVLDKKEDIATKSHPNILPDSNTEVPSIDKLETDVLKPNLPTLNDVTDPCDTETKPTINLEHIPSSIEADSQIIPKALEENQSNLDKDVTEKVSNLLSETEDLLIETHKLLTVTPDLVTVNSDSVQEKTDSVKEKTDSVKEKTDSVKEKTDSVKEKTDSIEDKTEMVVAKKDSAKVKSGLVAAETDPLSPRQEVVTETHEQTTTSAEQVAEEPEHQPGIAEAESKQR